MFRTQLEVCIDVFQMTYAYQTCDLQMCDLPYLSCWIFSSLDRQLRLVLLFNRPRAIIVPVLGNLFLMQRTEATNDVELQATKDQQHSHYRNVT